MVAKQPRFSPKQVAQALEVSESSVKRWCDKGSIVTIKTMGGHRRITLDALQQFVSDSGRELRLPHLLGLPQLANSRTTEIVGKEDPLLFQFRNCLAIGNESGCRQVLKQAIEESGSTIQACERMIADAMRGIGAAWEHNSLDVYQERRGCEICVRLINQLRAELPAIPPSAPIAFGGTPEGDPYQLASALVELGLREAGWNATNLGSNLPLESFLQAAHDTPPRLVWMSVSAIPNRPVFVARQNRLAELLSDDVSLLVGGRAITPELQQRLSYTAICKSVAQLVEIAEAMHGPV